MASTHISRAARTCLLAVSAAALALASTGVATGLAHAAPARPAAKHVAAPLLVTQPSTPAQVEAVLATLSRQNEQLSEQLNAAQIALKSAQAGAVKADLAATLALADLDTARQALVVSLAQQYRASSFSHTAALLTSDSGQGYLDKMQSLDLLAAHQSQVALLAASASTRSKTAQSAAARASSAALRQRDALVSRRAALTAQAAKYTMLLHTLTAAARATYFASKAATPAQVQQLAIVPVVAPSKVAATVIAAARAQLGKPYVYGSGGPSSFDCSGLVQFAFAAAGISLPHNAAAQYGYGTHVSAAQLQPGDLVFFYSPISHVGIYIGDGLMIHAPTSGDVVRIASAFEDGAYVGATRIA